MVDVKPDVEMASSQPQPDAIAKHDAIAAAIRAAVSSTDVPPADAAAAVRDAVSDIYPQNAKTIYSTLLQETVRVLKEKSVERALYIIDVSTNFLRRFDIGLDDSLPITLLEYLFSFLTISQIAANIDQIRPRFDAYRTVMQSKPAEYYLIKLVECVIHRDPHGTDPVLSGRLRLMLAASLPVWHPSGVNRRGHYNTHPITTASDDKSHDVALYNAFWSAQAAMQSPYLAEDPDCWRSVQVAMSTVLSAFDSLPPSDGGSVTSMLTSPGALRLQLSDTHIRRHVLLQYAIFLQHLESVGGTKNANWMDPVHIEFCRKLFLSDGEGAVLRARVFSALDREAAGKYRRFVQSLLHRERRWVQWKRINAYDKLYGEPTRVPPVFRRRRVGTAVGAKPITKKRSFNDWRSRQASWAGKANWASLREASLVPGIKELRAELEEDMKDEDITEDTKRKNNGKYVWRALRMLCEENVELMSRVADHNSGGIDLERILEENGKGPSTAT